MLLGQTTKQPLCNFEPRKPWKYKQNWGWGVSLVAYKKSSAAEYFYRKVSAILAGLILPDSGWAFEMLTYGIKFYQF